MGNYLTWMKQRRPVEPGRAFWTGLGLLSLGLFLFAGAAWLSVFLIGFLPGWLEPLLLAFLLKPMFSVRALLGAGESVKKALQMNDLPKARRLLAWHLVSRDTATLNEAEVAGAAVESLAENLTDSIIAPIFYFVLFGLPGAVFYRFVNTADAVLGYRTPELEYFGKAAARLDDALNFIPARLAGALLALLMLPTRYRALAGCRTALTGGRQLPSPNAGWTMGVVAGGLGLRRDKRGVYVLNRVGRAATVGDIRTTQRLVVGAAALGILAALGVSRA